jgi:hypothetical protein
MSIESLEQSQQPVGDATDAAPGSFEARMRDRRRQRESRTTELFEPPGFEDLFRVEMQVVAFKPLSDIVMTHQRQRDESLRNLYINADIILKATVGFHLVQPDGSLDRIDDADWVSIAQVPYPELDDDTRPRVALIRLLDGQGIATLAAQWNDWNTHGNAQVDGELRRDFSVTG